MYYLIKKKNHWKRFKEVSELISMKYSVEINKVCLSRFDNKRYILEDGYTTRAYGHYLNKEDPTNWTQ